MSVLVGAPHLVGRRPIRCEWCRSPALELFGVNRYRIFKRARKAGWAMVCAACFEQLGRPDDPVVWR